MKPNVRGLWLLLVGLYLVTPAYAQVSAGEAEFLRGVQKHLDRVRRDGYPHWSAVPVLPQMESTWVGRPLVPRSGEQEALHEMTLLTPAELNAVFQRIAIRTDLAFRYTFDGCSQRAYLIGRALEMNGVYNNRIWLQAPKDKPFLVENRLNSNEMVAWTYHTAIIVLVQRETGPTEYVIDPALFNQPVTREEWIQQVSRGDAHAQVMYYRWSSVFGPYDKIKEAAEMYTRHRGISLDRYFLENSVDTLKEYFLLSEQP
jgi:hypothetical protein